MAVSSLCSVSFEPPLVSVSLARDSRKAAALLRNGRFQARLLRDEEKELAKDPQIPADSAGLLEFDCEICDMLPVITSLFWRRSTALSSLTAPRCCTDDVAFIHSARSMSSWLHPRCSTSS